MPTSTPSDLRSFLEARTLPRRLLRVGLALTSTVYTLRPDMLLAKSMPGAGTSSPANDWLGENGVIPFVPPAARFHSRAEVFFIDAGVADPEAFWLAVPRNATVVSIPAGVDSWAFMAQEAEKFRGLAAIHLVSHGEHGALILNGRRYAAADLAEHLGQLRQLGRALTRNGDIFLYGCEAGAGREGQALLDTIAGATGADVAASSGDIGSKAKGGHWDLEVTTGPVDRSLILNAKDMADYDYVLLNGTANSVLTLKNDLTNFSNDSTDDTITIMGNINFATASDAITINKTDGHTLTIVGGGFTINGNNLARVINVAGGSVVLSDLTIENGFLTGAGGNRAAGAGLPGGDALGANILNAGTLTISNCTITGGKAAGGGGAGGDTFSGSAVGAGGGGGGFLPTSTFGGVGGTNFGAYVEPGPSAGTGQAGSGYANSGKHMGGYGGTISGGAGANYGTGYANAGSGGTASNGTISIGGGGGGEGFDAAGGRGGNAVGGIYNTGTLTITGSSITGNIGAGGGGGGGGYAGGGAGGVGGSGVGGIWNAGGTLHIDSSSDSSLSTGNAGGAGAGGTSSGGTASSGTTAATISGTFTLGPNVTDGHISIISSGSGTGGDYKIGDTVTARWDNTASGDNNAGVTGVTMDFSQFGGGSAIVATNSSGIWTASYTIVSGSIDATNRNVSVTATISTGSTTTADTTNLTVDNIKPTVTDARISISGASGTGGAYKIGDTVIATWNNTAGGDNNSDTISGVTVDFSQFGGGSAVAATNSSGTWTATYTITSGSIDTTSRNVSVTATDNAGNATTTADTTNATVDNIAPTVTDANISISGASGTGGAYKIGDTVIATWNNTAGGDNNSDTISGVTVNFSQFGGGSAVTATNSSGTWTATYTIVSGAINGTTNRNVSVTATDNAGNATTTADTTNATVDNIAPTVTDANISISGASGTGGAYKIGDTVTATWNNTAGGDNNSDISGVTVNFSQFGGGSAVTATNSSGTWTATYTIVSGAINGTTNRNVSVTATDNAGNATTTADTTNATVDNVAPIVTDANISISGATGTGGVYKIGDTVTATWNNTAGGDNNSDISGVTVNFSQFGGGSAVTATNSSGTWTATYTIVSGAINGTNRNISVTATDNAGNATTTADTTNATVDNIAPIVTDANISISGATGTGGVYRIGDTVTATWNNTAGGDNNSEPISSVTVDFSQFGGGSAVAATNSSGTWTATYTITSGAINGTNRNISVTATDNVGNATTTADTTNATVDNVAPIVTLSGGSAAFVAGNNTASTPVTIDSGLTVTDLSSSTLVSGTVRITGNFVSGEDVLAFTNDSLTMGDIAGSYNATTGVLTLTSSSHATLAQWQAALRSVTYTDTAVTPNNATRTISFVVSDGTNSSATATRTVTVTDTDQSPIVTTAGSTTSYLSGAAATTIDGSVTVSDLDNTTLASGTVSIGTGFQAGDTLSFTNDGSTMGNILGSYNSGTGVLTLTSAGATATLAQWQAAFRSVTFSSSSPSYGNRTISFVVNDGTVNSAAATDTVNVTSPVNVTTSGGSAAFVAGNNTASTPVTIDPGVTVADATTSVLQSATVSITGNFHSSEDVLGFTNNPGTMGNIAASYNSGTGVLTLTSSGNSATLTQWQAAMRAVTYTDTAVTPNTATRTISFSITDANSNISNTATRTVTVADTDQSPIATTSGGSAAFVAGNNTVSTPVVIDGAITVSDLDNTTLASATVSITGNFHSGEDVLAFTNNPATMGNILGSYNSGTGVLTLTSSGATATLAQWQAALRAVTYTDTAVTPNNATRTISFVVNDGTVNGNTATRTVTVADTDQSPIVTTSGGSAAFVAGNNTTSTPVVIDSGITVSDLDNTTLASATVSITGNFHGSEDVLAFTNNPATMGNILGSYNSGTGVLTLTSSGATATIAQWRAALRAVTYTDTAVTPNNATRTISFVVNDGTVNSNPATRTVTVTDTDQSPIVITSGGTTNDLAGASAVTIDGSVTVSDLDNTTQLSGTVSIGTGFHSGEDVLAFTNNPATMGNILGSYNSGTGVLTLTSAGATATDAQWQAALRSVTYADTAVTPNTSNRTVSFVVNDGTKNSAAGTKTVTVTSVSATYPAPAPDGFASSATGGAATGAVTVTTAANFITQAQSSTPAVITVAGLLNLGATPVTVNSNKTIQGADANAALVGNLTLASGVSNVIIRGLNITNPGTTIVGGAYTDGGDGITIAGASNVFITHCTFFDTANHAIEITNGADKVTISWCEFYYTAGQTVHRDSVLIGAPGAETAPLHVTLHHNFWSTNVDQQMPVATFGYVHLYSNDFNAAGNTSGTVSSDQAQLLSELNVYTGMANPLTVQNVNTSLPIGRILALGNSYTTITGSAPYSGADQVFTPSYSYEALPASDVAAVVSANAGNIAGASYTDAAVGSASITGPSAAVTPATAFTLTAVPASFTPSTYQWRLSNQPISGATASTYTVSNTQAANAGVYTVAIGLASGDVVVSTPFTVTLGATPPATPTTAPSHSSAPWYDLTGGGAMSDWFLGALAMLATLRKMQQRRRPVGGKYQATGIK